MSSGGGHLREVVAYESLDHNGSNFPSLEYGWSLRGGGGSIVGQKLNIFYLFLSNLKHHYIALMWNAEKNVNSFYGSSDEW